MRAIITVFILIISISAKAQNWQMVWSDEFNYKGLPDNTKWTFDTEGNNWDWGNAEAQNYTLPAANNAWVDGTNLVIEARKEQTYWAGDGQTKDYSSARIITKNQGDWLYGKVEVRALLPTGKGMWPAIWMLPTDWTYGDWPASGEMDIMENVGYDPNTIHCNIHTKSYNHTIGTNKGNFMVISAPSSNWHTYSLEWDAEKVSYFCDGNLVFSFANEHTGYATWPFDKRFHLLLNVSVGGSWGGSQGIDNTIFPQQMKVDYVRVYKSVAAQQAPYKGVAATIPGTIEAENYDEGGQGVSFFDATPSNQQGQYRNDAVDIETCADGGYNIGYTADGEWLEYTVNATQAGSYDFYASTASEALGGTIHFDVDGATQGSSVALPVTGAWQTWKETKIASLVLSKGEHIIRFAIEKAGFNFNKLRATLASNEGFLRADGMAIKTASGANFVMRGIGTGNWMVQEGYMMQAPAIASTQHGFRKKLVETIGEDKTNQFYDAWLKNQFRKVDVDSMAAWGFNAVRVAMHYQWFTPSIEQEPVAGQNTWLPRGFEMMDSLLAWCAANKMYLILDMHAAPGGEGRDANISDYDTLKPSLWESEANKQKLVALWTKLADRYKDAQWLGGYDLLNETNWDFENSGNKNGCSCMSNTPLADMHRRMIDGIRSVDKNHVVFVSGNCWGNRYEGMDNLFAYDNNLVITFHKYWNTNTAAEIQGLLNLRTKYNKPLWMSESGENSNTWFTDAVHLLESNNIGWSWWPVKKAGINNILTVTTPANYQKLMDSWEGKATISANEAFNAVMEYAQSQRLENCTIMPDVADALIRQPFSTETKPYKMHSVNARIYASDFDMGQNGYAYSDKVVANYHVSSGKYTEWNTGWTYRNDGVDIQTCTDTNETNGYNVAWIEADEWMNYTINVPTADTYELLIRWAAPTGGTLHVELDGQKTGSSISLTSTGGWTTFKSQQFASIALSSGLHTIKLYAETDGYNLNYFMLRKTLTQTIPLAKGWNLISTNVRPADSSVTTLFNGLDVQEIKTMDSFWRKGQTEAFNGIKTISAGAGYLVYMNVAGTLTVAGTPVETLHATSLPNGWQLIGCPYQTATPLSQNFNTTNCSAIKDFTGFWIPNGTANSLQNLEVGKGYFIKK